MTATEAMERTTGNEAKDVKSESNTKPKDHHAPTGEDVHHHTKKRRKVSHACLYCRRSERPCTRCVKRNIGHLCHDEPRDQGSNKSKSVVGTSTTHGSGSQPDLGHGNLTQATDSIGLPSFDSNLSSGAGQSATAAFDAAALGQGSQLQLVQPTPVSGVQANALGGSLGQFGGFSDQGWFSQNHFHEMHSFHPGGYLIAPEVSNEFNLLNDFVQTSLLDETALVSDDQNQSGSAAAGFGNSNNAMLPPSATLGGAMLPPSADQAKSISRPTSTLPVDKAREYYLLQAADPSGNATPTDRIMQILRAKIDAGLLKPFDYIKGYARLATYLNGHVAPASKQKILRQLDRFRPKFREKMQGLSNYDLTIVEVKVEGALMDYDRVFASMAVPACVWRRTGEIFRGNKEMAELIKVPVEKLRGGQISLHEILTEDSVVRYWEEFGTIAFDSEHDTLLTACSLKSPYDDVKHVVNCCFSFRIRRDDHKMLDKSHAPPPQQNSESTNKIQKHVTAALELTHKLLPLLSTTPSDLPNTDSLVTEIASHVEKLHLCCQQKQPHTQHTARFKYLPGNPEDVDGPGTKLWNLCTRLRREESLRDNKRLKRLFLYGRALAFWLVGIARSFKPEGDDEGKRDRERRDTRLRKRRHEVVGVVKLGLKVVRGCIEEKDTKLAGMALQLVADYKGVLQDLATAMGAGPGSVQEVEEKNETQCFEVEYFILRTAVAWIENRLDVAEHMYIKAELLREFLTRDYAERLADVLYEIGKSLYARRDYKIAIKWLERANETINGPGVDQLSQEGIELRLAILQALISALLGAGSSDGLAKARNYVDFIEVEVGNKLVVSLLKLEILHKTPGEVFDTESYTEILQHIIRNFNSTEPEFKLITYHIRKLHDKSPGAGCSILDDFTLVLRTAENPAWMEKALVTRMWMVTNQRDSGETVDTMMALLGQIKRSLSAEASVAVQALLWKQLESSYSQGQYQQAESWCQLALHSTFENCGVGNTAKLQRKLLLCALARNNMDTAVTLIQGMSDASWKDPMTAYLAFKVAIRTEDRDLAEKCLETVAQTPDHVDYLGACIAESQKSGDVICAIAALKRLRDKYEWKEPNPIHLPALFRCTIRLLSLLVDRADADSDGVVEDLCEIFDAVLYSNMRKIVNEIWVLESFDAAKLAKYTRCLFQATLPLDDGLAMRLLDESCSKARELRESQATWPEEELEWMAATAFNHAIDCFGMHEIERAKEWGAKAINLAHYCNDGGRLEEALQGKYLRLNLHEEEEL
ncbi:meiosis protein SPO22/ZIP4 like-domain-containing protein [Podospora australis]|uniref:Meiosis protein SPO22/ZIP4 like-domain-containing protein n=1 Tax=Podospora australis TaxID=1536484 RepID=A0AAN6WXP1_9PEZI|nr:meiosis protein SPO22/ZIP4 like-domain-containing protein [Podospora australis]